MTSEASEDQIQEFMADPELTQLAEHLKVTSDLLDIVELSEVQHSDMLAWCMNPAEGHGQGDAVLKDFLIAACVSSRDQSCQSRTHAFFSKWTLSKIRVTSFGSAWVSRELSNVTSDGKKGRLDLCIVDPQNRIIVVIEHKRGAKLNQAQLDKYWQAVDEQIASKPAFEDYLFAYVVLDKKYEDPKEEDLIVEDKNTKMGQQWALCDYSWLTSAAQRAAHQVARDNSSAQLLMAYCQKQTEWENPAERKITYLAASLASKHERVVDRLREIKRLKLAAWTPKMIS